MTARKARPAMAAAFLLVVGGLCALGTAAELGPGLHAKLPCGGGTPYTCTVYLPPAYANTTDPLPALFLSNPGGKPAVADWQTWADAREVVVIGIDDSRNGLPLPEIERIQDAVLKAVDAQLRLHPYLRFSTGASGGAMVSAYLAQRQKDSWAGVLMRIHGGNGIRPDPSIPMAFLVGEKDKVYPFSGVQRDYQALREAGNALRLESYPELGHGHIPQADCERMLDWLLEHARLTHPRLPATARRQAREKIRARLLAAPAIADLVEKREEHNRLVLLPKLTAFQEADVRPVLDFWFEDRLAWIDGLANVRTRHFYLRDLVGHPAARLLTGKQRQTARSRLERCRQNPVVKEEWEAQQAFAKLPDLHGVSRSGARRVVTAYEAFAKQYPDTPEGIRAAKIAEAFRQALDTAKRR